MTNDNLLPSFSLPDASPSSSILTPIIHTPPSEESSQINQHLDNAPSRRLSPLNFNFNLLKSHTGKVAEDREVGGQDYDGRSDSEDGEGSMTDRPPMHRPTDGRSGLPLLKDERGRRSYDSPNGSARPAFVARRSTFRSRSPEFDAQSKSATRTKYTYAAFFLVLSLISFVIQTETAVYIQHELHWDKAYCML